MEKDAKVAELFRGLLNADDCELNSLDAYLIKPVRS